MIVVPALTAAFTLDNPGPILYHRERMPHFLLVIRARGGKLPVGEPVSEQAKALIPRFKVLLHNDDVNSMEHVVRALMRVFRFDAATSEKIMLEAHRNGFALCAVEPLEQAELHRDQLLSFSLTATIEPE